MASRSQSAMTHPGHPLLAVLNLMPQASPHLAPQVVRMLGEPQRAWMKQPRSKADCLVLGLCLVFGLGLVLEPGPTPSPRQPLLKI